MSEKGDGSMTENDKTGSSDADGIAKFMKNLLKDYDKIRGKACNSSTAFWDVVIITTADEDQRSVFQAQIDAKHKRGELPTNLTFLVISDPPGPKLGNGGSTLTAMSILHEKYHDSMFSKKILLVHAGGQSKRMPSTSILGKIFSPIPYGSPIYQMLDLKLAMYMPFIPKMGPGVFVACADDMLVYNLGKMEKSDWSFATNGFTVLGHPSTVAIGTKHGVYVVEDEASVDITKHIQEVKCVEVLQKPSIEKMKQRKAILNRTDLKFPDGIKHNGKIAYTDSSFFFGMDVAKKLIQFNSELGPLDCEIDAYGDFLQALGPNATSDYTSNIANVTTPTPSLIPTRLKVFEALHGFDISLLLMNSSKFIHIGTTKEYIHHFCFDTVFQNELGLQRDVFNAWVELTGDGEGPAKKMKYSPISDGCVMHSLLPSNTKVLENTVVEYSSFDVPIDIGQNSIVSNCAIQHTDLPEDVDKVVIPHNIFIHTVPVKVNNDLKTSYVTVAFHIDDNLKKEVPVSDLGSLPLLGYDVEDAMEHCHVKRSQCLGDHHDDNSKKFSLWNLCIFSVESNMTASFLTTLQMVKAIQSKNSKICNFDGKDLMSMETILKKKDVMTMLALREKLHGKIQKNS